MMHVKYSVENIRPSESQGILNPEYGQPDNKLQRASNQSLSGEIGEFNIMPEKETLIFGGESNVISHLIPLRMAVRTKYLKRAVIYSPLGNCHV